MNGVLVARRTAAVALLLAVAACAAAPDPEPIAGAIPDALNGTVTRVQVPGPSLVGNVLGDSSTRSALVYLPPTYAGSPQRRYPVVYLLHGFGDNPEMWETGRFQQLRVSLALDSLAKAGVAREMIVVMPNAKNAYGGSFYVNSVTTGRWEDFIARDLVSYMDQTYRTRPRRESRAVVGLSMGGFGALNLAFHRPDVFASVYALSPCCLDFARDTTQAPVYRALAQAKDRAQLARMGFFPLAISAIGAAASPNPARPPFFLDLPYTVAEGNAMRTDSAVLALWRRATPLGDFDRNLRGAKRLHAIGFEAGSEDAFKDIPILSPRLSAALTAAGVVHQYEGFSGGHTDRFRERFVTRAVPFISKALR